MRAPRRGLSDPDGCCHPGCTHPRSPLSLSRDRRDRHRSKSREGSRGDKSVTIQAPGEPLLDNESTRGDERVSWAEEEGRGRPLCPRRGGRCRGWEPPAGRGGSRHARCSPDGAVEPVGLAFGWRTGSCQRRGGAGGEGGRAGDTGANERGTGCHGTPGKEPGWAHGCFPPWGSSPEGLAPAPGSAPTGDAGLAVPCRNNPGARLPAGSHRGAGRCRRLPTAHPGPTVPSRAGCRRSSGPPRSPVPGFNGVPATHAGGSGSFHLPPPRSRRRRGFSASGLPVAESAGSSRGRREPMAGWVRPGDGLGVRTGPPSPSSTPHLLGKPLAGV